MARPLPGGRGYTGYSDTLNTLRGLDNDTLEAVYIEGLEAIKVRGDHRDYTILAMVEEELDRRIDVGLYLWD